MNKNNIKKFEFLLYINGKIICQRYFTVKNYNYEVIKSIDLYDCINDVVYTIQEDLKDKSIDYLWKNFNEHEVQKQEDIVKTNIYEKEDIFDLEIRIDDKSIIKRTFTGNVYPQRVRYSVDIREIIPSLISRIQETLNQDYFTVEYCGTVL